MTEPLVEVYMLESGTLALTTQTGQLDTSGCSLVGMAISPDGKSLDVACRDFSYGLEVSLSGLDSEVTYDTGTLAPSSVAVSSSGQILFGEGANGTLLWPTENVFRQGDSAPLGQFDAPRSAAGAQLLQAAWGASDGVIYGIEEDYDGAVGDEPFSLVTTHAATAVTITAPSVVHPGQNYQVIGRVVDGDAGAAGVQVSVTGLSVQTSTLTTDASGTFTLEETGKPAGWQVEYSAELRGDYAPATEYSPGIGIVSTTVTSVPVAFPLKPAPPVENPVPVPLKLAAASKSVRS
jgi:hypothetical protein